jgi:hypothetical protein
MMLISFGSTRFLLHESLSHVWQCLLNVLVEKKGNSLEQYENIQSNNAHFDFELKCVPDFIENRPGGTYEKARLRFAHAETVVPFSCLLGLFLEGSGIFSPSPTGV